MTFELGINIVSGNNLWISKNFVLMFVPEKGFEDSWEKGRNWGPNYTCPGSFFKGKVRLRDKSEFLVNVMSEFLLSEYINLPVFSFNFWVAHPPLWVLCMLEMWGVLCLVSTSSASCFKKIRIFELVANWLRNHLFHCGEFLPGWPTVWKDIMR